MPASVSERTAFSPVPFHHLPLPPLLSLLLLRQKSFHLYPFHPNGYLAELLLGSAPPSIITLHSFFLSGVVGFSPLKKKKQGGRRRRRRLIMYPRLIHPHDGIVGQEDVVQGGGSNLSHKGDPCLVLTADPKPRLRWTQDLHERFVDAVTQLGGASSKSKFKPFSSFNSIFFFQFFLFIACMQFPFLFVLFFLISWKKIGRVFVLAVCDASSRNSWDAFRFLFEMNHEFMIQLCLWGARRNGGAFFCVCVCF